MNLQSEAFNYILKQYLKGKKDNINLILLSLRNLILEKCNKYNLEQNEIKTLIRFIIHGIDTYSFEKAMSFYDYINLYIEISLKAYKENKDIETMSLPNDEFFNLFTTDLEHTINSKKKQFYL